MIILIHQVEENCLIQLSTSHTIVRTIPSTADLSIYTRNSASTILP